jgi:hypothetical protein
MFEERVKRLESDVAGLRSDVKAVRADLAELKGRVSVLPGYPGIAVIMAIVSGAFRWHSGCSTRVSQRDS